ncbi:MAG TPA: hypothetical protein VFY20_00385 [Gemmatimonadales bacterium]|nr:hypothetical protein [Gemmatimonadales bacterium]
MSAPIPALVVAAERRLVERLVERRAFSSSTAVPLLTDSFMAKRRLAALIAAGVVNEERPGQYWVNQAAWEARRALRFRKMMAVLAAVIAAAVGFLLMRTQ